MREVRIRCERSERACQQPEDDPGRSFASVAPQWQGALSVKPCCCLTSVRRRPPACSCPDATGLGVDIARMLLDFGLKILKGDISTDGQWCFIIFKVGLSSGARL